MTEDVKNGKFHIFDENGELAVDKYEEYLIEQRIEENEESGFPLYLFDKLLLCEIYKMLKGFVSQDKGE